MWVSVLCMWTCSWTCIYLYTFGIGSHPSVGVEVLPLDLGSDEDLVRKAVEKAESFFGGAGVHYMVHNAALERPVGDFPFSLHNYCCNLTFGISIILFILLSNLVISHSYGDFNSDEIKIHGLIRN